MTCRRVGPLRLADIARSVDGLNLPRSRARREVSGVAESRAVVGRGLPTVTVARGNTSGLSQRQEHRVAQSGRLHSTARFYRRESQSATSRVARRARHGRVSAITEKPRRRPASRQRQSVPAPRRTVSHQDLTTSPSSVSRTDLLSPRSARPARRGSPRRRASPSVMTGSALLAAAMRRKHASPPSTALAPGSEAARPLNLADLTLLGVGGTLGSGLFLLTGHAARMIAGPAVTLSFACAAVACLFSALSYAEMSSRNPNSGGAYAFAYAALGELPAFLVGMCLTLEYGVSAAAIARSWASYVGDAAGFLPAWTVARGSLFSALAFLLVLGLSLLLAMGMEEAKWVINSATVVYALVVLVILLFGFGHIEKNNWDSFFPFGTHGVIAGSSAVFFAYIGFDEVACVAEEAQDSARTVPLAILFSLFIVTTLYIGASLVLTGMVKYLYIDVDAPFSAAFRDVGLNFIAKLVGLGTALGMMNTTTVALAAQPRIFLSMGRDGLLPRMLAFSTAATTIGCGIVVALLALVIETQSLTDVVSGGTLLAFLATNISLLLTRSRIHTRSRRASGLIYSFVGASAVAGIISRFVGQNAMPEWLGFSIAIPTVGVPTALLLTSDFEGGMMYERNYPTFMCPLVPVVPLFGAFTTCFLLFQLSDKALSALCTWLAISATSYFCYGARNAIIANDYVVLNDGSPTHSYNSFDNLAMEAHSIPSENESGSPKSPVPEPAPTTHA